MPVTAPDNAVAYATVAQIGLRVHYHKPTPTVLPPPQWEHA